MVGGQDETGRVDDHAAGETVVGNPSGRRGRAISRATSRSGVGSAFRNSLASKSPSLPGVFGALRASGSARCARRRRRRCTARRSRRRWRVASGKLRGVRVGFGSSAAPSRQAGTRGGETRRMDRCRALVGQPIWAVGARRPQKGRPTIASLGLSLRGRTPRSSRPACSIDAVIQVDDVPPPAARRHAGPRRLRHLLRRSRRAAPPRRRCPGRRGADSRAAPPPGRAARRG